MNLTNKQKFAIIGTTITLIGFILFSQLFPQTCWDNTTLSICKPYLLFLGLVSLCGLSSSLLFMSTVE